MQESAAFLKLLWGTVVYRPYVYAFFVCFLFFALKHLRPRGTLIYLVSAYLIAYFSEFSATRNGFPFGIYTYLDETRTRELWISNIPFWDSLSFVFLSYFSWVLAGAIRSPSAPSRKLDGALTAVLGGLLMMALDVVIDPLTLLGDRWFLGRIYYYPGGGSYFGVTLSNFAGWFFVGTVTILIFQRLSRAGLTPPRAEISPTTALAVAGVYSGVFLFNWALTAWIGEWTLFLASAAVIIATLVPSFAVLLRKDSV